MTGGSGRTRRPPDRPPWWVRAWIGVTGFVVPPARRGEWREEWLGELSARWRALRDGRLSSRRATRDVAAHALGALPDAYYLRMEGWSMGAVWKDVTAVAKGFARRPGFTVVAAVTLAVGIGANTAVYSVVDGVLLNPLPFPGGDRIVSANHTAPGLDLPLVPQSEATYLVYHERARSFEAFAGFSGGNVNLIQEGDPRQVQAGTVTSDFFPVLGVQPFLGRGFLEGEDRPGAEPVVVLGYTLWRQAFGADRGVVGRLVEIDGVRRRVIGVMPEGFEFPDDETSLWIPLEIDDADPDPGSFGMVGIARLAPGVTLAGAQREMQELFQTLAELYPDDFTPDLLENAGFVAVVKPLKDLYTEDIRQALWILLGTVGFVLLIACANVANLFLVRAEARTREMALRRALGASRVDLVRRSLVESVLMGVSGGGLGLALAAVGVPGLMRLAPVTLPSTLHIGLDRSVLAFTLAISVGAGLLFGVFPAIRSGRGDLSIALREGGRSSTAGGSRNRARSALVVAQIALALVLLVGSGLMLRSFQALRAVDPGFETDHRLTFRLALPEADYPDASQVEGFYEELRTRLGALPGVRAAAMVSGIPLGESKSAGSMEAEGHPLAEGELPVITERRSVTPGYFRTMGIPLVEGRDLQPDEGASGLRTVVVSESFARRNWPGDSALGRRVRRGDEGAWWEVVGVAGTVRFERLDQEPIDIVYFPVDRGEPDTPQPARTMDVVLHVEGDPLAVLPGAREVVRGLDARLPVIRPRTMQSLVDDAMSSSSFTMVLLGIAAGMALLLGTVGIYGVVSYVVGRRTQEIGVRIALGASRQRIQGMVVRQGMLLAGVGVVVGLLGATALSSVLSTMLFGVSAMDPVTYAGTAALLSGVALLATWLPARRAAAIAPVEALREE